MTITDWTPARVTVPRYRIDESIQVVQGVESRLYVIRDRTGEAIAETPHAWAAPLMLAALNKSPRKAHR